MISSSSTALFHQRPFIWHIWDGRKRDGFHALVNYHKLADGAKGQRLLESLTHSYLGEWITRQRDGERRGEAGAGILCWKPNIKWDKDRGKEPQRPKAEFPWFWKGDEFTGDRVNDVHLTNDPKRKARCEPHGPKK
jgi:hypothetical protein